MLATPHSSERPAKSGLLPPLDREVVRRAHGVVLVVVLALGMALIVPGLTLALGAYDDLRDGQASAAWPTAEGTLYDWRGTEGASPGMEFFYAYPTPEASDPQDVSLTPKVHSSRRKFGERWRLGFEPHPLDSLPKASPLRVHYDPDDPSVACLEPGVSPRVALALPLGLLLLLSSPWVMSFLLKTSWRLGIDQALRPSAKQRARNDARARKQADKERRRAGVPKVVRDTLDGKHDR